MKLRDILSIRPAIVSLALLGLHARVGQGLTIAYCSNQNTAPEGSEQNNIYNSNGACQTHCQGVSAFAVVQYQSCWCADYVPGTTTSVSDCNQPCPGFPSDKCGNAGLGLYGYIALSLPPSGTLGSPTPSASNVQPPSTDESPSTEPPSTVSPSTVSSAPSSSSSAPPAPLTTTYVQLTRYSVSTEVSSATYTPTPVTSVRVVYVSGAPVMETVTSTPTYTPISDPDTVEAQRRTGLSAGGIAGVVLGVLFGVAAVVAAAFLLWRRCGKRSSDPSSDAAVAASQQRNPRRNVSVLSKTGLLARARPSMGEREHDENYYIPPLTGQTSMRQSMLLGLSTDGVDPSSPLGGSQEGDSRRPSKPFIYDQRLNPSALYANHDNGSRVSMQDNNDYSRPLGVANPDTRPSFESHLSH